MDIESIIKTHADTMKTGIEHGEQFGAGKVAAECGRMLDACGISGEWNQGYRKALSDVIAYVGTMRRPL
jgi:hypothetical protein